MAVNYAGYEQQRRNVFSDYAAKMAANDYGRFVAQQRGARQLGDAARGFESGWGKRAAGWGARGQTAGSGVRSGFFQRAMRDYATDYQRSRNDLMRSNYDQMRTFDMEAASLDAQRQRALAELELAKQREIAMLAQNIAAVQGTV